MDKKPEFLIIRDTNADSLIIKVQDISAICRYRVQDNDYNICITLSNGKEYSIPVTTESDQQIFDLVVGNCDVAKIDADGNIDPHIPKVITVGPSFI